MKFLLLWLALAGILIAQSTKPVETLTLAEQATMRSSLGVFAQGPLRVACVGTSITQQASFLVTDTPPRIHDYTYAAPGWLEHLSDHRIRLVRRSGVAESATDKTFGYSGYGLPGLTDGSLGVFPLDNAIASGAEVLLLEGGTNDIAGNSAATVIARITSYWTKAAASGKKVIAFNILPTTVSTTNRDTITTANAALPALAASLNITLIDTHAVATKDGNGFATTETLWDGVHPTPAYAHRLAVLANAQLASLYGNRSQEMFPPSDYGSAVAAGSFVVGSSYRIATLGTSATPFASIGAPAGFAVGTVFTATGVGTGNGTAFLKNPLWVSKSPSPSQTTNTPDGWAFGGTAATRTFTLFQDPSNGAMWQRVRLLATTPGDFNSIYIRTTAGATTFAAGDKVRVCARIRAVSGATVTAKEIEVYGTKLGGTTRTFAALTGGANLGTGDMDPVTGLFISPIYTIPADCTDIDAAIGVYNTDITFDVRQFGIFKVVENH